MAMMYDVHNVSVSIDYKARRQYKAKLSLSWKVSRMFHGWLGQARISAAVLNVVTASQSDQARAAGAVLCPPAGGGASRSFLTAA